MSDLTVMTRRIPVECSEGASAQERKAAEAIVRIFARTVRGRLIVRTWVGLGGKCVEVLERGDRTLELMAPTWGEIVAMADRAKYTFGGRA